ncbi:MAG TPA: Gfo/Idh/MocA family oxidoreductase [Xanthobacteraceae bacterium]|jgi:predicted dehydrogenase|nr:Gfo/Idh/MocA family oxidoreductase [Xanthobacteraceae bacterium]
MRVVVVGLGVQGHKRRRFAADDYVCSVDTQNAEADHRDLRDVAPDAYDAALLCVPDAAKIELLNYLVAHGKHALIEKPLVADNEAALAELQRRARAAGVVLYVAYNHRFEPHFVRMRDLVKSGALGKIYRCRMFYGNGTARLVRNSDWRDRGAGVLDDLGSHVLDTARFWFGDIGDDFAVVSADCFENRSPDHVVFASPRAMPRLEFEMTLLSWRNHFTCDVFAENGSAHISSLCKWGPSEFTHRTRVLPSGRPPEQSVTLVQDDPTWALEYEHFKTLCQEHRPTDLTNDIWLNRVLRGLGTQARQAVQA